MDSPNKNINRSENKNKNGNENGNETINRNENKNSENGNGNINRDKTLGRNFDHKSAEDRIYQYWCDNDFFHAEVDRSKKPFSIMMPPPNVTGVLHMGHALDSTLEDIIIRFKRMQGFNAMWLPGTDHASISTEVKITNKLKSQGIEKDKIGRDKFLEYALEWKNKYENTIVSQIKRMGCSCDWRRLSFTMDENLTKAVNRVFVDLYNKNYIYRGEKLINWCPKCKTTISDAEVDHKDLPGKLWHLKYPINDTNDYLQFATTRPETLLGDTAIAVNPNDERYKHLAGKTVTVPFVNRIVPIIFDEYVDMEYGTGVVKITPAHDPNDFEVGQRHNLPLINVFNDDGSLNENAAEFANLNQSEARQKVLERMKELGLYVKSEDISHSVGLHERCDTVVEPMLKPQWFVRMDELAKPAIEAYKSEELNFHPKRFGKIYLQWLENIKDWCISRQLWWGHRIPAYYCNDCGHITVAEVNPNKCEKCNSNNIHQDDDVLDTWFSSALWPFATLGWPDESEIYNYFYPTDVLVTGYDIIFFWVVRMVFSALEHTKKLPFKDVLIHGLIRDEQGRKMSKSLDNGINPIDAIEKYGCDSLRMTLVSGSSPGNDLRFYWDKLEANYTFVNKLWNAAKFILMNSNDNDLKYELSEDISLTLEDKWILSKLNSTIAEVTANMENYEHGLALDKVRDFIWNEFCDWYVEFSKPRLYNSLDKKSTSVLKFVFVNCLKLLHPFAPFVTEELFQYFSDEKTIMLSDWPKAKNEFEFSVEEKSLEIVKTTIKSIRNLRTQYNVHPAKRITAYIVSDNKDLLNILSLCKYNFLLCGVDNLVFEKPASDNNLSIVVSDLVLFLPLDEMIDFQAELERLEKEKEKTLSEISRASNKLDNASFVKNAPEHIVNKEREKLSAHKKTLDKIEQQIKNLKGGVV